MNEAGEWSAISPLKWAREPGIKPENCTAIALQFSPAFPSSNFSMSNRERTAAPVKVGPQPNQRLHRNRVIELQFPPFFGVAIPPLFRCKPVAPRFVMRGSPMGQKKKGGVSYVSCPLSEVPGAEGQFPLWTLHRTAGKGCVPFRSVRLALRHLFGFPPSRPPGSRPMLE
eukprot:COSAG04_NODE_2464_length_4081_cov_2.816675_1_plen_170_part_00